MPAQFCASVVEPLREQFLSACLEWPSTFAAQLLQRIRRPHADKAIAMGKATPKLLEATGLPTYGLDHFVRGAYRAPIAAFQYARKIVKRQGHLLYCNACRYDYAMFCYVALALLR